VLNFTQIFWTVLISLLFVAAVSAAIHQQRHPPGGEPKHLFDLLMLLQFLICAFGAILVVIAIAGPWGTALDTWYFPAHNALAASVGNGCSLSSFTVINQSMNRAYGQATQIQSTLTSISAIVGVCSFGILALYARVFRGRWNWIAQFFTKTQPEVEAQQRDA
jgi:hypothetical protein